MSKILKKEKLDKIKDNWDIILQYNMEGKLIELPKQQQLLLHLIEKTEDLELRLKKLEEVKKS